MLPGVQDGASSDRRGAALSQEAVPGQVPGAHPGRHVSVGERLPELDRFESAPVSAPREPERAGAKRRGDGGIVCSLAFIESVLGGHFGGGGVLVIVALPVAYCVHS